jgi:hypothetical protein
VIPIAPESRSGTDVKYRLWCDTPPSTHVVHSRPELCDATFVVNPTTTIETFVIVSVELTHGSLTLDGDALKRYIGGVLNNIFATR